VDQNELECAQVQCLQHFLRDLRQPADIGVAAGHSARLKLCPILAEVHIRCIGWHLIPARHRRATVSPRLTLIKAAALTTAKATHLMSSWHWATHRLRDSWKRCSSAWTNCCAFSGFLLQCSTHACTYSGASVDVRKDEKAAALTSSTWATMLPQHCAAHSCMRFSILRG